MEDFYLFDSPSAKKLKGLKKEYTNLDVTSVLTYFEIQKAYKKIKMNHDDLFQKFDLSESKFTIMMLLSKEKVYVVYDWTGGTTLGKEALLELYKNNYEAYELAGALEGWKGMKLPLENVV